MNHAPGSIDAPRSGAAPDAAWSAFSAVLTWGRGRGWYTRSRLVRAAYRRVLRAAGPRTVTVDGNVIELDPGDSMRLLVHHVYEPEESAWYHQVVQPGDTVVEAGAHIGVFTNLFAALVGTGGHVVAFEPDPETATLLRANLRRNGHEDRVTVHEAAAGSQAGSAAFFRSAENTGDNRLFGDAGERTGFAVRVVRLDDLIGDLDVDLLKMDVQGSEPAVLAGMTRLLGTRPPRRILLEFWPYGMSGMGLDPVAMLDQLTAAGYELAELDRDAAKPVPFDRDALLSRLAPDGSGWTNLIATHPRQPASR